MGAGRGKARRARSSQMLVRTSVPKNEGALLSLAPLRHERGTDPGRSVGDRADAYSEVVTIIEELRESGLREEALQVLDTSARLLLSANSLNDETAQKAVGDVQLLLKMIEDERWGAMAGSAAYPGSVPRLRKAFASCAPPLDLLV